MVATARATELVLSFQPNDSSPTVLVPIPQKNMAGAASTELISDRLRECIILRQVQLELHVCIPPVVMELVVWCAHIGNEILLRWKIEPMSYKWMSFP